MTAFDQFLHRRRTDPGSTDEVTPFLKWAGGKRWLLPLARQLRSLSFNSYIEPFLGSGAMFFGLRPVGQSLLSDRNADLIETYEAIKADWGSVQRLLAHHQRQHSETYYYECRQKKMRTAATRAARFIYLNRTCWNGLYRVNKRGEFNVPVGTKTNVLLESDRFDLVANALRNVELSDGDFEAQINRAKAGDLIFADPPYTVRHQYNGFIKYNETLFSWEDQQRLHAALTRAKQRGAMVICTNADHNSIRSLYSNFTVTPVERYSAIAGAGGVRGNYAELIITG